MTVGGRLGWDLRTRGSVGVVVTAAEGAPVGKNVRVDADGAALGSTDGNDDGAAVRDAEAECFLSGLAAELWIAYVTGLHPLHVYGRPLGHAAYRRQSIPVGPGALCGTVVKNLHCVGKPGCQSRNLVLHCSQ